MDVKIISCWFASSYGVYTDALRRSLESRLGHEVGIVASNCGCGDAVALHRQFQDDRCDFFVVPNIKYFKSSSPLKYRLRTQARSLVNWERARQFHRRGDGADVVHFQQILNATGSVTVFHWLGMKSQAARVVTVHELDPHQLDFPASNLAYNRADRIIVHCQEMKDSLIWLGVQGERIEVVQHGVHLEPLPDGPRDGIIFYGGHRLHSGKGLETLCEAMRRVKERLGAMTPVLRIHGHWGEATPEEGEQAARAAGLMDDIQWLNQIKPDAAIAEYRRALLCVLPYTGSFAGYAAGLAMAHGVPVIATRRAGLPDHLGDAARYVATNDADGLGQAILELLADERARQDLVTRARAHAEALLGWDTVAERTLDCYGRAIAAKRRSLAERDESVIRHATSQAQPA